DMAHAPLRSGSHAALASVMETFARVERYMSDTADALRSAAAHAHTLAAEAAKWRCIAEGGGFLRVALDESAWRVSGRRLSSLPTLPTLPSTSTPAQHELPTVVSQRSAHP
ncbi:unnamed protein product, partial [Agarophyton chilense]